MLNVKLFLVHQDKTKTKNGIRQNDVGNDENLAIIVNQMSE